MTSPRKVIPVMLIALMVLIEGCIAWTTPIQESKTTGKVLSTSVVPMEKIPNASVITVEINPNLELFAVLYILALNGSDLVIMAPSSYMAPREG